METNIRTRIKELDSAARLYRETLRGLFSNTFPGVEVPKAVMAALQQSQKKFDFESVEFQQAWEYHRKLESALDRAYELRSIVD